MLHPYVIGSGASLDLPIINESPTEEFEDDDEERALSVSEPLQVQEARGARRKTKAYSHDTLVEEMDPMLLQPGPSSADPYLQHYSTSDPTNTEKKCRKVACPRQLSLHQSLMLPDNASFPAINNDVAPGGIRKSHSTQNFDHVPDDLGLDIEIKEALKHSLSLDSRVGENIDDLIYEHFCDTNKRHNDRYPEANDVDNLDNEIVDALTLETGNLPDLTEEQSSSLDESTRRDDIWSETLSVENLNYLHHILCLDQEGMEGSSLEAEWEASGEGCEHLHLVLKYWNFLVLPFPELRQALSWGQVRCYCSNCQPDAPPALAGNCSFLFFGGTKYTHSYLGRAYTTGTNTKQLTIT